MREREREREAHTYVVHKHEGANFENLKFIWVKKKTTGRLLSTCH
jgi:hypothetical protein